MQVAYARIAATSYGGDPLYRVLIEATQEVGVFGRVPAVDVAEARQLLNDGALLLDVRRDDEWQAGHAPGARHIPLDQLRVRSGEVPPDRSVVAVCRSGARSGQATHFLRGAGLDVVNLDGGMRAWARAGGDIVRDDGGHGYVA